MKVPSLLLCLPLCFLLCSCVHPPCGAAHEKPKPSDFSFTKFKRPAGDYDVAVTRKAGSPLLMTQGLGGLDEATLEWAKELEAKGWKVYLPMLDGEFGKCEPLRHGRKMEASGRWKTDDLESSGPVLDDMGLLADWISRKHGHRAIVVVGNCLTGAFPLALLERRSVKTAVLCQPAMPLKTAFEAMLRVPQSREKREAFGIPDAQLKRSLDTLSADASKRLLGFHYLNDPLAPMDKFHRLHAEMERRGKEGKFKPVVLVPANSAQNETWWEGMDTSVKGRWLGPHVTLTGAEEPDRQNLRARFDQLVRP